MRIISQLVVLSVNIGQDANSFIQIGVCTKLPSTEGEKQIGETMKQFWGYNTSGFKSEVTPMSLRSESYGPSLCTGDVMTIVLDMDQRTLQYWHNDKDLGIAFTDLPDKVLPAVTLRVPKDQVSLCD